MMILLKTMEGLDPSQRQQFLGLKFGQHKGTPINAYGLMKSGMKNLDSSGNCGPISNSKAQQIMDDYVAGVRRVSQEHGEHEEDEDMEEVEQGQGQGPEHEQELNAKVLYDVSAGMLSHGHIAIGNGAFRAAAKGNNVSQSNSSVSMQMLAQQNIELRRENARLQQEKDSAAQQSKAAMDLTLALYHHLGLGQGIPGASLRLESAVAAAQALATGSHAGSESTNGDNAVDGHNEGDLDATYRAALETLNLHSGNHA